MAKHPPERSGRRLRIRQREVDFSFWPMNRGVPRPALQSRVFASEPWNVFERTVNRECPPPQRAQALAYLDQAKTFFKASSTASVNAAKPLLIYYSLMNIAKVFGLTRGIHTDFGNHHHGMVSDFSSGAGPQGVKIKTHPTAAGRINLFDMLLTAISGPNIQLQPVYELERVLPQVLLGHRLWCDAAGANERFIETDVINFRESRTRKEVWLRFDLRRTEHLRLGYTQKKVKQGARLNALWRTVEGHTKSEKMLRFETLTPVIYSHRSSDILNMVANEAKHTFWRSITSVPPFRKYYVYVADSGDHLMPQLCSIYMIFFYLGSITRYRPQFFDDLIAGDFGAFIQEFIQNQPNQWLYMMASEMAQQEVTRAAVV